jgi:uncharacterized protein YbjT (DUF2867 family)
MSGSASLLPLARRVFVVGGTGRQGAGVIAALAGRALLRTVTRRARAGLHNELAIFADQGRVEVLWEREMATATVEEMTAWLEGCQGLFLNLDYWSMGAQLEQQVGQRWVNAAQRAGVAHVVYSTLENCSRLSDGRHPFEAFDSKTVVEDDLRTSGLAVTFVKFATYFENFIEGHTKLVRQVDAAGQPFVSFAYPTAGHGFTLVPCHDAGRVIAEVLLAPERYLGQTIGLASEHLTLPELAACFEAAVGVRAEVRDLGRESANAMWQVKQDHEDLFKAYVAQSAAITPDLLRLSAWFQQHAHHWQSP